MSTDAAEPAEPAFDLELEKAPPKDSEEAFRRYVEVLEKSALSTSFEEFPAYDVEMTSWMGKQAQNASRVKLSRRVKHPRAILKTLLTFRNLLKEFEEDEG